MMRVMAPAVSSASHGPVNSACSNPSVTRTATLKPCKLASFAGCAMIFLLGQYFRNDFFLRFSFGCFFSTVSLFCANGLKVDLIADINDGVSVMEKVRGSPKTQRTQRTHRKDIALS